MLRYGVSYVLATALLVVSTLSYSQDLLPERRFYASVGGLFNDVDDATGMDDGFGYQLAIGKVLNDYFNAELVAQSTNFSGDSDQGGTGGDYLGYGLDLMIFPARERLPVYLLAGYLQGDLDRDSGLGDVDVDSKDVGVGFMGTITNHGTAIRAEYRYRQNDVDVFGDDLTDNVITLGIYYPFGSREKPAEPPPPPPPAPAPKPAPEPEKCPDNDNDGVCDDVDQCPNTPAGAKVDEIGCALGDCRLPQPGEAIDENGCAVDQPIILKGVNFEFNKATLLPESKGILDDVASTLKEASYIKKVEIGGHTDSKGPRTYNQNLSEKRAKTVEKYLIDGGIEADRLTSKGYGEDDPIEPNTQANGADNPAGRAKNRRVELKILERDIKE